MLGTYYCVSYNQIRYIIQFRYNRETSTQTAETNMCWERTATIKDEGTGAIALACRF